MADLTLAGLRVVREVALSGSFSAAARALGYSQPAISRQVAAVEAAAGAPLFVREARGVALTAAGEVVARHATDLLAAAENLEEDLAALRDRLAGRVVIGAYPTATAVLVPRAVAALARRYPGLRAIVREAASPVVVRALRSGRVDVGVVALGTGLPDYDLDGLAVEDLPTGELRIAVPDGHRLAAVGRTGRVPVTELAGEGWIVGRGQGSEPQFGAWPTLRAPDVRHRVGSWPGRLGLVAAGLGICVIPQTAAASVPAGVRTLGVDDPGWRGRRAVVVTRASRSRAAAVAVTALREVAGEIVRA